MLFELRGSSAGCITDVMKADSVNNIYLFSQFPEVKKRRDSILQSSCSIPFPALLKNSWRSSFPRPVPLRLSFGPGGLVSIFMYISWMWCNFKKRGKEGKIFPADEGIPRAEAYVNKTEKAIRFQM